MARVFSLLLAALAAVAGYSQAYGVFGGSDIVVPGFNISSQGIRVSSAGGDLLRFDQPLEGVKVLSRSDRQAMYFAEPQAWCPDRIRVDLRSPGFEIHTSFGLQLHLSTLQAPILTVDDASYDGITTPAKDWVLIGHRDKQPPILLAFPDGPQAVEVSGRAGNWTLTIAKGHEGWFRVCLPLGQERQSASHVSALGAIAKKLVSEAEYWTAPSPVLESFKVHQDGDELRALWMFDRPGALVPPAALLSAIPGSTKIISAYVDAAAPMEDGPTAFCTTNRLELRFPMPKLQPGRPLGQGEFSRFLLPAELTGPKEGFEAAMALMRFDRPSTAASEAESLLEAHRRSIEIWARPLDSGSGTHVDLKGDQVDKIAAGALVQQAVNASAGSSARNQLLAELLWQRGWRTWAIHGDESTADKRAAAAGFAAIACALDQDPARRLDGAMLRAGLDAQNELPRYRAEHGLKDSATANRAPVPGILQALMPRGDAEAHPFGLLLRSPVGFTGDRKLSVSGVRREARFGWFENELRTSQFTLASDLEFGFAPVAQLSLLERDPDGIVTYRPSAPGFCRALIRLPEGTVFPPAVDPPAYSATESTL